MRRHLFAIVCAAVLAPAMAPPCLAPPAVAAEAADGAVARADALARAGKTDEALSALEWHLALSPGDTQAELVYARTLGWAGMYEKAIAVYRGTLSREAGNAEAHAGLARVLSWNGEYAGSIEEYRRSLYLEPGSTETRMGLARVLWWKGDPAGALDELERVIRKDPENAEALGLERRLREERGPVARGSYANSADSDDNRLQSYRAAFYSSLGTESHRFEFAYRLFEPSVPGRVACASILDVKDTIRLANGARLMPRIGIVMLDYDAGDTVMATGGVGFSMDVARSTELAGSFNRYPLVDTVLLVENEVVVDEASLGVRHDWRRSSLGASVAFADYSDGNTRYDLSASLAVRVMDEPRLTVGAVTGYRDFSEKTASGYFNPAHILSSSLYADVSGGLWRALGYHAKANIGIQAFEGGSDYTTAFQAGVEWAASRDLVVGADYKYARSALESASGFRFDEIKAFVNYLY